MIDIYVTPKLGIGCSSVHLPLRTIILLEPPLKGALKIR